MAGLTKEEVEAEVATVVATEEAAARAATQEAIQQREAVDENIVQVPAAENDGGES
jgi:hypothetical protein